MLLSELTNADKIFQANGLDTEINGLTADSRTVEPGYLFAAIQGSNWDGRKFITDAITRGAAAILAPCDTVLPPEVENIPIIKAKNPRRSLSLIASQYFKSQPRINAAVTGTNGKTSVAWFTQTIWKLLGHNSAAIGTLGIITKTQNSRYTSDLTTPDPVTLHRELYSLTQRDIDRVVLEASSHGLEQSRLDGVKLSAGAFTNLSRDHLDHHGSMKQYRSAKLRLFDSILPKDAVAILNSDSPEFRIFSAACQSRGIEIISYGREANEIRLDSVEPFSQGQKISLTLLGKKHDLEINLVGQFQILNVLCALGLIIACGDEPEKAIAVLPKLEGPPGRLELVSVSPCGASIFVDYAHTPEALSAILIALRFHTAGNLSLVFGCGGNRDQGKRDQMGQIASKLADKIYVTDDNPRDEKPNEIRREILAGCPFATEIGDRSEAIQNAIMDLGPGDTLVIAGKGHETGQIIGRKTLPLSDSTVIKGVISAMNGSGP